MKNEINKKTKRMTINFRENIEEQELYEWIKQNGVIGGDGVFVKSVLYKEYLRNKR